MLDTIILPTILQIIGAVVGLLLSAVLYEIRRRTGVQIRIEEGVELSHLRERLAEAIINGAKAAMAASVPDKAAFVLDYLKKGVPDTLEKLGAADDVLLQRAKAVLSTVHRL
ncbi:hypothetical protein EYE35_01060 [Cereibacter sphaeroides]|nr:hypothetical protein EYE35_01060 [Cereibacter sphaeroides]RDS95205.1 hypothetical protein DWF04_12785 [Cereibacter sphaeroides f. sp. denitrificans]